MLKKYFLLCSVALTLNIFAAEFKEAANAAGREENFATPRDLADQYIREGDWRTYEDFTRLQTQEEQDLVFATMWVSRIPGFRTEQEERDLARLAVLRRLREQNEQAWMRDKLAQRARRRRQQEQREARYARQGHRPRTAAEMREELQNRRAEERRERANDRTPSGIASNESIWSLHPYGTYSIFGLISLFFMYKFANKNGEEVKS